MKMLHLSKAIYDKYYIVKQAAHVVQRIKNSRLFQPMESAEPTITTHHALVGTDEVPANAVNTHRVILSKGITYRRTEQKPLRTGSARRQRLHEERAVA